MFGKRKMNTDEKREEQVSEEQNNENLQGEETQADGTAAEAGDKDAELKEANDKYLRLYAEFDNYRRRAMKEKVETIAQANKDLLLRILPVVDDFDRAMGALEKTEDLNALREGVQLIYNKLRSTLQQSGITEIGSKGEAFDPELHDAITQIPAPTPDLKGKVVDEIQKGYFLNDKIIRHAKVVVGE
jgi:molecular chaperone GrpE